MTLVEVLMVMAIAAVVLVGSVAATVPMLARETMRGATYDVQSYMQQARGAAVSRNRPCRFVIDTGTGQFRVLDGMGTPSITDDEVLMQTSLASTVALARPDTGAAVTLNSLGSGVFDSTFNPDGTVGAGAGLICLFGGDHWRRMSLFAAGGLQVEHWNGTSWANGS